jgi:aromatic ring-cleaving dioxygenase
MVRRKLDQYYPLLRATERVTYMSDIDGFHAHVYFSQETLAQATVLCENARDKFGIKMGRIHERPVGPHPVWSCQLSVGNNDFAAVIPWLAMHREGLTIFIHPNTADALADHSRYAMWMGQMLSLNLTIFTSDAAE